LKGGDESGQWRTSIAEPYPHAFGKKIAGAFMEVIAQRQLGKSNKVLRQLHFLFYMVSLTEPLLCPSRYQPLRQIWPSGFGYKLVTLDFAASLLLAPSHGCC